MTTSNPSQKQKMMVQNISCIIPQTQLLGGLFLGNTYGAQNSDILKQYGIRAVLTTSIQTPVNYNPIQIPFHLKIDAHDKQNYQILNHLQQCLLFIAKYRQLTNVYVHCYAGVSRSSTIVIAYIMKYWKWNLKNTVDFVQGKRIVAKPNQGFMQQLKKYQQYLLDTPDNKYREISVINPNHVPQYHNNKQQPRPNVPIPPFYTQPSFYTMGPNLNNITKTNQYSRQNQQKPPQQNNNNYSNPKSTANGIKKTQTTTARKHSQTPIPKILTTLHQKNLGKDRQYESPNNNMPHSNSTNHTRNIQMPSVLSTNLSTNNNNKDQPLKNTKSTKAFIRPKDLPGYKR